MKADDIQCSTGAAQIKSKSQGTIMLAEYNQLQGNVSTDTLT